MNLEITLSRIFKIQDLTPTLWFGYVLFFMTDEALDYLESSDGWEIGVGPSLVVVDEGVAGSLTSTTTKDDIYAFIFNQEGLMAGLGIQGSKISRITPE